MGVATHFISQTCCFRTILCELLDFSWLFFSEGTMFLLVGTMGLNECLVCLHGLFLPFIILSAYLLCLRPSGPHKTGIFFFFFDYWDTVYLPVFIAIPPSPQMPYSWMVLIPAWEYSGFGPNSKLWPLQLESTPNICTC